MAPDGPTQPPSEHVKDALPVLTPLELTEMVEPLAVVAAVPEQLLPFRDQDSVPPAHEGGGGGGGALQVAPLGPVHAPPTHEYVAEPLFPLLEVAVKLLPLAVDDTAPVHELPPTDQPTAPATQLGTGGGAQEAPLGPVHAPAEHE